MRRTLGIVLAVCLALSLAGTATAAAAVTRPVIVTGGDSLASGLGRPLPANATRTEVNCARSDQGFPNLLAATRGARLVNTSCTRAAYGRGMLASQHFSDGTSVPSQLSQAKPYKGMEAYIDIVGLNSLGWVSLLGTCAVSNCDRTLTKGAFYLALGLVTVTEMAPVMVRISLLRAQRVIGLAYPNPFGGPHGCLHRAGITEPEIASLERKLSAFNSTQRFAYGLVPRGRFAPFPTGSHGICASNSYFIKSGPAKFHLNARGVRAAARAVNARWKA